MIKRHPKKTIALAALIVAALYLFWPGFSVQDPLPRYEDIRVESFGSRETATINVLGVEAHIKTEDFASATHLEIKLSSYLEVAREQGLLRPNTLVVFPAHMGTGLLATHQKSRVYNANSIADAITPIISYDLMAFAKNYFIFNEPDKLLASTIRAKSKIAADTLFSAFSALSKKYNVTIVAGSGLLMTPGIYPDSLTYGHGPIFHTSFVFGPSGKPMVDAIRQVEPSAAEMLVTEPSLAEFIPTFTAGSTKYAVLIGADAKLTEAIDHLLAENVDIVLSPQFHERDKPSNFTFGPTPRIKWGMAVSMTGDGWGIEARGSAAIVVNGEPISIQSDDKVARLYNLWVSPD